MSRTYTYRTTRFRRWSRASYAIFASLHREVSIGRVSTDIADASLAKNGGTPMSVLRSAAAYAYMEREPEENRPLSAELPSALCALPCVEDRGQAAEGRTDDDIYKQPAGDTQCFLRPHNFILHA